MYWFYKMVRLIHTSPPRSSSTCARTRILLRQVRKAIRMARKDREGKRL